MVMARSVPKKIGILGGTFDPIHHGHLALAQAALEELGLDEVLFVVAARPPHKPDLRLSPFIDRLAMVRLAIKSEDCFAASDVEVIRSGPSYSVDTLQDLRHCLGEAVSFFFLIGLDAFVDLPSWKEFRRLPELAELVVVHRPGSEQSIAAAVHDVFGSDVESHQAGRWVLRGGGTVREMVMEPLAISSTEIRKGLEVGEFEEDSLLSEVAKYIKKHGLYHRRQTPDT